MRRLVLVAFCEPCHHNGIEVQAVTAQNLSIGRGPVKELDLCDSCNRNLMAPLLKAYEACEQEPPTPKQQERLAKKAEKKPSAPELPAAPPPVETKPTKASSAGKLICLLDHPTTGDGPKAVDYEQRGQHMKQCHPEFENFSGTRWEDPNGILKEFCTAHKSCLTNEIGFTSVRGLSQHINNASMERIDV